MQSKYVFVYIHTLAEAESHPSSDCLKRLLHVLDSRFVICLIVFAIIDIVLRLLTLID